MKLSKHTFGTKVKVKEESWGIGEIYTAFYPKIEVNGKFVYIYDESYKTNKLHGKTRYEARKLALDFLEGIREKQQGALNND